MDKMPKNDLGVDPDEWFENPLDSMPIATNSNKSYDWEDTAPSEYEPPDEDEEDNGDGGLVVRK